MSESKMMGGDLPPAEEVRQAVNGFVTEFKGFQSEIETKLQQTEERMTMLDRKMTLPARTPLSAANDTAAPHQVAFQAYLRNGDDDGLRGLELEGKSMSTAVNSDGGYLVDPQTSERVQSVLNTTASIRAIAAVVQVEATSYDVLVDHTDVGAGWATETDPAVETDTPQIDRITIALHELSALPKASQRLLDDSAFDIEGWLSGRIADKFARAEADAFINGDGIDKPKGLMAHSAVDNVIWSWGNLGYVPTGIDADLTAEAIVDLVYALGAQYRANGSFVMNSKTAGLVRKLKDGDGRFMWSDGLAAGEPARLMGYPVLVAEDMPDVASDAMAIAFGDFNAGYTVAERPDLRILRDPFSAKPHVLFYATKRVGGDVSDFAAIKLLKFGLA
ncbi:phage major capsid protein [Sulfitobacter mediterraneus]|uniref:phage major capsid protein n=1 Tax=Sulfitobacter mediterraneus TaxID=83219 RepID=UPI001939C01E|nr:phage major capsid protein [Sulfitobacter mediterraneus]MBM1556904.1 phage major capsid protein [Sulfitobacter mediterraneus]MBM1569089.1 phage major capsid protein [Sulfitobacter mediterraneus]MBM1572516.1 phage major capsid protein [Sulfitobacter mediterraneus]MBM1576679.1 phage major capsid protein [Sulfitobacter mediterraneus]MBM1579862.1 phage major capsid protein [Sulfitobacter mediterraneus]